MKKLFTIFLIIFAVHMSFSQTTLINPTGAGGFELGSTFAANGWTVVNSTTNSWVLSGVAIPYAGSNSAFISEDGGTTYSYNNAVSATSHFYRDISVPAGEIDIQLNFQWKGNGESGWDRLLIYTAPTSVTPVVNVPLSNSTSLPGASLVFTQSIFPQSTYQMSTVFLPPALAGTTFRLIFTWQNDNLFGNNPPVSIDNISLVSQLPSLFSLPYSQSFDALTFPPAQWTIINAGSGNNWTRATDFPYAGAGVMRYFYHLTNAANAWAITPGFLLNSATKYRIKFWQRVRSASYPEKLKVTVGDAANVAAQTAVLWDNAGGSNLMNTTYIERSADFIPSVTDTFYFAFNCYSDPDMWNLYVDEVNIDVAPSNDIGIVGLVDFISKETIVLQTGLSREQSLLEKDASEGKKYSISFQANRSSTLNLESTGIFSAFIKNFGDVTENSYSVGWRVNGVSQPNVNNTEPLEVSDVDTLTLNWASATPGIHQLRAWTVLSSDTNPNNDSSSIINFEIPLPNTIFREPFEGSFPPPGWDTVNVDGGGNTPCWFLGNPLAIPPLELNGYAASNFQGANGYYIDNWLITPNTGGLAKGSEVVRDSLTFWMRSIKGSIWDDTVEVRLSTTGTSPSNFTILLARIHADTSGVWKRYAFALPNAANRYIAFRYVLYDGGPLGTYSNYVGIDLVEIQRYTSKNLNLTALLEGLYDPGSGSMMPDIFQVQLRNASAPYSLVDQADVELNSSGNGTAYFFSATDATFYYIVIKHRNGLETWSATPQAFSSGLLNYNFTTAASQAYGSNQVLVGTKYCLYSGDVSDGSTAGLQDGYIDIFDDFEVNNDSYLAIYRLLTDINLDGIVDIFDDLYVYNNSYIGVTAVYPGFPGPGYLKKDTGNIKTIKEVE